MVGFEPCLSSVWDMWFYGYFSTCSIMFLYMISHFLTKMQGRGKGLFENYIVEKLELKSLKYSLYVCVLCCIHISAYFCGYAHSLGGCGEPRDWSLDVFFYCFSVAFFLRQDLSLKLELTVSAKLSGQLFAHSPPDSAPECWDNRSIFQTWLSTWVLRMRTQVFMSLLYHCLSPRVKLFFVTFFFFTKELKEEQNCSIESCSHLNESGSHKAPVSECLFPRW